MAGCSRSRSEMNSLAHAAKDVWKQAVHDCGQIVVFRLLQMVNENGGVLENDDDEDDVSWQRTGLRSRSEDSRIRGCAVYEKNFICWSLVGGTRGLLARKQCWRVKHAGHSLCVSGN